MTTYSDQKVYRALLTTCTDQKVSKWNNRPSQQLAHPAGIFKPAHKKREVRWQSQFRFSMSIAMDYVEGKKFGLAKSVFGEASI